MVKEVQIPAGTGLDAYAESVYLSGLVDSLKSDLKKSAEKLKGRTVWMVNSTAEGGGVAEMLPRMIFLLNESGIKARWLVISTDKTDFFDLTKRIHNLIHGAGKPELSKADRALYEQVSDELTPEMKKYVKKGDLLVIHDPQPAGAGENLRRELGVKSVWRCHVGLDQQIAQTKAVWNFLKPYVENYDRAVFTAPEYIPSYLKDKTSIIHPALDPFTAKNRELRLPEITNILYAAGLAPLPDSSSRPVYKWQAERLQPDGTFKSALLPEAIPLLSRPCLVQISRWDNLKGWEQLFEAFIKLKKESRAYAKDDQQHLRVLQNCCLVMAGPETAAVKDDPEAQEVLQTLCKKYTDLPAEIQQDTVLLSLPMSCRAENALMVSALHNCASLVVQNSLQEGFGLTATEPMWKGVPVVVSSACGLRQQVTPGVEGLMINNPRDPADAAAVISQALQDPEATRLMAQRARKRVRDQFLIFTQLSKYCKVLNSL